MRQVVTALALLSALIFTGCGADGVNSPMDPHPPPCSGPWFEGWYTRITDANGRDSVAAITGSFSAKKKCRGRRALSGYVAILRHDPDSGVLKVYEAFPQRTTLGVRGQSAPGHHGDDNPSDFLWKAEGIGRVSEDSIELALGDRVTLKAQFGPPEHWDPERPRRGPEGVVAGIPIFKAHWFVHSLASPADYVFRSRGVVQSGSGYAHQEKNWGERFPSAYGWAQGSSPDGKIKFTLAGGTLPLSGSWGEGWLLGVRTRNADWDFRPQVPGTIITTRIDACNGSLAITAKMPFRTAVFDISAKAGSFAKIAIPMAEGFLRGSVQSFSATARISLYRHGLLGAPAENGRLIETVRIPNAALEFGGGYLCE